MCCISEENGNNTISVEEADIKVSFFAEDFFCCKRESRWLCDRSTRTIGYGTKHKEKRQWNIKDTRMKYNILYLGQCDIHQTSVGTNCCVICLLLLWYRALCIVYCVLRFVVYSKREFKWIEYEYTNITHVTNVSSAIWIPFNLLVDSLFIGWISCDWSCDLN